MKEPKDYFIAIYDNAEVRKLSAVGELPNSDVRYLIHCKYERTSSTGKTVYYKNTLYNSANERIEDNTFDWDGIICKLEEEEKWGLVIKPSHNGVALTAEITDRLSDIRTLKFDNTKHSGTAFQKLMKYLTKLAQIDTHNAIEAIRLKDKEIDRLKKRIERLKK